MPSKSEIARLNDLYEARFGYKYEDMDTFEIPMYAESTFGVQLSHPKSEMFKIRVHPRTHCQNPEACVIHNPSDHHMKDWLLNWRADRGIMERICPEHGVGHPDPDDVSFHMSIKPDDTYYAIHGCDGCCIPTEEETDDQAGEPV